MLTAQATTTVDFDLHGIVGIRLLDANPGDAAAVAGQLGPIQAKLDREPDITIRFVDRLPNGSRVRLLGVDEAGFTDDSFLVLRSKHKSAARVQIPFDRIGKQCEIVCESGLPAVPLLIPILNVTALAKGALPLHASAFGFNGKGVLTTGWSKGGKTETLLAFMAHGARYVGDEWVYITGDGKRMHGIPEPIRVWDWHLQYLPKYRALVSRSERARHRAIKLAQWLGWTMSQSRLRRTFPARVMNRLMPVLKRQLFVDMHPVDLFGDEAGASGVSLDKVFFVVSHESPDVTVCRMDPQEVARRMVFSLQYERQEFVSYYMKFRFAFPESANDLVEQAEETQRRMLERMLEKKDTYVVYHPYPVPIPSLFDAMSPLIK